MWIKALVWIGLFLATVIEDYLGARWVEAATKTQRAWYSAIHEAVIYGSGFIIYAEFKNLWMALPCIAGAWVGSRIADMREEPDALDTDLVVACQECSKPYIALLLENGLCPVCTIKDWYSKK